jgi:hypothetical protein
MQITIDGKPLNINLKTIAICLALLGGGFGAGTINPNLNPMQLFETTCEVQ